MKLSHFGQEGECEAWVTMALLPFLRKLVLADRKVGKHAPAGASVHVRLRYFRPV